MFAQQKRRNPKHPGKRGPLARKPVYTEQKVLLAQPLVSQNPDYPLQTHSIHSRVAQYLTKSKRRLAQSTAKELKRGNYAGNRVSDLVYAPLDEESGETASPFISLNTIYRFRLAGHSVITCDSSGTTNGFFACDPSSSGVNFPEWNLLAGLFSEFRLVKFCVQFIPRQGNSGTTSATAIAGNLGTAAAPGSFANLMDNADCRLVMTRPSALPTGYTHVIRGEGIGWSQVTTPTTEPFAGAPGSIQYYNESSLTATTVIWDCMVWGIYEFRSRV